MHASSLHLEFLGSCSGRSGKASASSNANLVLGRPRRNKKQGVMAERPSPPAHIPLAHHARPKSLLQLIAQNRA
jgi:hypothetical protein